MFHPVFADLSFHVTCVRLQLSLCQAATRLFMFSSSSRRSRLGPERGSEVPCLSSTCLGGVRAGSPHTGSHQTRVFAKQAWAPHHVRKAPRVPSPLHGTCLQGDRICKHGRTLLGSSATAPLKAGEFKGTLHRASTHGSGQTLQRSSLKSSKTLLACSRKGLLEPLWMCGRLLARTLQILPFLSVPRPVS